MCMCLAHIHLDPLYKWWTLSSTPDPSLGVDLCFAYFKLILYLFLLYCLFVCSVCALRQSTIHVYVFVHTFNKFELLVHNTHRHMRQPARLILKYVMDKWVCTFDWRYMYRSLTCFSHICVIYKKWNVHHFKVQSFLNRKIKQYAQTISHPHYKYRTPVHSTIHIRIRSVQI